MRARRTLLSGARVVDPVAGRDEVLDVLIEGTAVAAVGADLDARGAAAIDCQGLVLIPGLVDLHAHLREPGGEHEETVETGSRAAALGGYTAVAAMANTDPVADHLAVIEEVRSLAARAGLCDVFPVGAVTKGLAGEELAEIGEMAGAGVRLFSDD
ncbi:MAG TPA: amidohydrolase family protein, partial [Actinomycetota bacterium]|nr:amidohydrolase family protein [Actinomycetota bacterium]